MADVLIQNQIYNNVNEVQIPNSDGYGNTSFLVPEFPTVQGEVECPAEGQIGITIDVGGTPCALLIYKTKEDSDALLGTEHVHSVGVVNIGDIYFVGGNSINVSGSPLPWTSNFTQEGNTVTGSSGTRNFSVDNGIVKIGDYTPLFYGKYKWIAIINPS